MLGRRGRAPRRSRRRDRTAASGRRRSRGCLRGVSLFDRELAADVVGRRLPSVVRDRARAEHLEVLRRARRRRARVGEASARKLAPSNGCCVDAVDASAGASMPHTSSIVGMRSTAWQNWLADLAARRVDAVRPVHDQRRARCRRATCSASTAATACCRPTPSPRRSGCSARKPPQLVDTREVARRRSRAAAR